MGCCFAVALLTYLHAEVVTTTTVKRTPVPNGGELVTFFRVSGDGAEIPVVSYLKDTMGDNDPDNDRIRQVWLLANKRQSWPRQILAAVPFLYTRLPSSAPPPGRAPKPLLDMGKPASSTVTGIMQQLLQVTTLDPLGTPYRAATRSYRLNRSQQRELRLAEATSDLAEAPEDDAEIQMVRARLILSSKLLGGLVSDKNLDLVHEKEVIRTEEMRGRNWELLRQQAERNHLNFEPLRIAGGPPSHALLSISREELQQAASGIVKPQFYGRFLGISNPWTDTGLLHSKHRIEEGDGRIPLALYSLEHPKAPFLLADMRNSLAPKRREITRRAVQDATIGILGVSRFAGFEYFAATWTWDFINNRRGAANNRAWRIRSYAELRHKLSIDTTLDPVLREALQRRIAKLSLNPLEDRAAIDGQIARVQYESLLGEALNPKGLALRLERTRQDEAAQFAWTREQKMARAAVHWLTFGLYQPRVRTSEPMLAEIDRSRKVQTYARRLEQMMQAAPVLASDPARKTARDLARLAPADPAIHNLLQRFTRQLNDTLPALNETTIATPAESENIPLP